MSFSSTIRTELGQLSIKPLCCRRAFLHGLLYGARVEGDQITAKFSVAKDECYQPHEQAVYLIRTLFSRNAEVTHVSRGAHRYALVSFNFKKTAEHLATLAELPEEEAECETIYRAFDFKCDDCAVHFLRGVFWLVARSMILPNPTIWR